jgi:hypothetical protein
VTLRTSRSPQTNTEAELMNAQERQVIDGLFDKLREAERHAGAREPIAELAVNVRSEAREAHHGYQGAYLLARAYQGRVPPPGVSLRDDPAYSDLHAEEAPGSVANSPAVLRDNVQAIATRRDFWMASTVLDDALAGSMVERVSASAP